MATPPKRDRNKIRKSTPDSEKPATQSSAAKPKTRNAEVKSRTQESPVKAKVQTSVAKSSASIKAEERHATARPSDPASDRLTIFTIGHSTHPIDEFIALLKHYGIEQLVDVRTVPKSRHVPQFNSDALAASLGEQGIEYVHLKSLGGLRHAKKDSVNMGWRNASFRGYADYMSTEEFAQGIDRLIELAKTKRTVIMCAEAVPWRCHRSLVGDALLVRDIVVEDIMSATSIRPHKLTEFANVDGQQITYPSDTTLDLFQKQS